MKQTAIGIRLPNEVLKHIEQLSKEDMEDRSTIIRKLVMLGYANLRKERAAASYRKGDVTLSEAAHRAGLTLWDMERYLVEQGIASSYSTDDLERELHDLGDPHSSGRGRAK